MDRVKLTEADKELMRDVRIVRFARLFGDEDSQHLQRLISDKLVSWRWNAGLPVYELTESGRALLASNAGDSK
jgi:hypothetical protein